MKQFEVFNRDYSLLVCHRLYANSFLLHDKSFSVWSSHIAYIDDRYCA